MAAAAAAAVLPVVAPAAAHACTYVVPSAQVVAPAEAGTFVQTTSAVPLQVRFRNGPIDRTTMTFGIARLSSDSLPPLGRDLPAGVGTIVETGPFSYDAASDTWIASANGNGWAQTPGEYVWQATGALHIPASPPPVPNPDGSISMSSCDSPVAWTLTSDGNWVRRFSVLTARGAVTATAAKARDRRVKVSGTVAKTFQGKVKLTVACPGKRTRSTFVPAERGRWSRAVNAKRGGQDRRHHRRAQGLGGVGSVRTRQLTEPSAHWGTSQTCLAAALAAPRRNSNFSTVRCVRPA